MSKRLNTLDDVRKSIQLLEELLVRYRRRELSAPDLGRLQVSCCCCSCPGSWGA